MNQRLVDKIDWCKADVEYVFAMHAVDGCMHFGRALLALACMIERDDRAAP